MENNRLFPSVLGAGPSRRPLGPARWGERKAPDQGQGDAGTSQQAHQLSGKWGFILLASKMPSSNFKKFVSEVIFINVRRKRFKRVYIKKNQSFSNLHLPWGGDLC